MAIYEDLPNPNTAAVAGLRLRLRGIIKALWTAAGLRLGDGNEPAAMLDVAGSVVVQDTSGDTTFDLITPSGQKWRLIGQDSTGALVFRDETGGDQNLVISTAGSVSLGPTAPTTPARQVHMRAADSLTFCRLESTGANSRVGFEVKNDVQLWQMICQTTDLFQIVNGITSASPFTIEPGAISNAIYVDASGNVGLNTALPEQRLTVSGNAHVKNGDSGGTVNSELTVESNGDTIIDIATPDANTSRLYFSRASNQGDAQLRYDAVTRALSIYTGGASRVVIDSSGNIDATADVDIGGELQVDGARITHAGAASNLVQRIQDGTGRANILWNSDGSGSPTYTVGSEDALRVMIDTGGRFITYWADGTGKSAGNAITWVELLRADSTACTYKSKNLVNPTAWCRVTGPPGSITSGAWRVITWSSETEDTDTMHSTVSNTERITFNTAGVYHVEANLVRQTVKRMRGRWVINGSTTIEDGDNEAATAVSGTARLCLKSSLHYRFAASDYIHWEVESAQSATIDGGHMTAIKVQD